MKNKINKSILVALLGLFIISCGATTGVYSPAGSGSIFVSYTDSVAATGLLSTKTGEACANNILGWFVVGDASIKAAKNNGGITKIATVDRKYFNVLFIFGQVCAVVTGE